MIHLTPREWTIYTCIQLHFANNGHATTMREIAAACGIAVGAGIDEPVRALAAKGVIRRPECDEVRCRAMSLVRGVSVGMTP